MTCNFTSFATAFEAYQDAGKTGKGCMQWNSIYDRKDFHIKRESNLELFENRRPALNPLSYWAFAHFRNTTGSNFIQLETFILVKQFFYSF